MRRALLLPLLLPLLLTFAVGCDSSGVDDDDDGVLEAFDAQRYVGNYSGSVLIAVTTPDTSYVAVAEPVTVSVAADGGVASVTLQTQTGDPVTFTGSTDEDGAVLPYTADGSTLILRVDRAGDVSGTGTVVLGTLRFRAAAGGSVTPSTLFLTLGLDVTQGNDALPAGSRVGVTVGASR